jgi:hypothetical protein
MYINEHKPCRLNLGTAGTHPFEHLQTAPFLDRPQRPLLCLRLRMAPLIHNILNYEFYCPNKHSNRVLGYDNTLSTKGKLLDFVPGLICIIPIRILLQRIIYNGAI